MIVKKIETPYDLRAEFLRMGRDYYTLEAYELMFDYLEDYSYNTGKNVEIDVIAFCGEFNESTISEATDDNCIELEEEGNIDELINELELETHVLGLTTVGTIVYISY